MEGGNLGARRGRRGGIAPVLKLSRKASILYDEAPRTGKTNTNNPLGEGNTMHDNKPAPADP